MSTTEVANRITPADQEQDPGRLVVIAEITSHAIDPETSDWRRVDSYTIAGRMED